MKIAPAFVWFLGHLGTCVFALLHLLFRFLGSSWTLFYSLAYVSTLVSYSIIWFKAHGLPQISKAYLHRIMMDENSQYLLMAVIWLTSRPLILTLVPYVVFSFFHAQSYVAQEILPKNPQWPQWQNRIKVFVTKNMENALITVAKIEVWVILPYLLVSLAAGYTGFLNVFAYVNFLRMRTFFSKNVLNAMITVRQHADQLFAREQVPVFVRKVYLNTRDLIIQWGAVDQKKDN